MPLLPELQPIADLIASAGEQMDFDVTDVAVVAEIRERNRAGSVMYRDLITEPVAPAASETDYQVPVDGGHIAIRVYAPISASPLPVHLHHHGGGFWTGTLDGHDTTARSIRAAAECIVVSVAYRLAPEAKFPLPVEDAYAALCWVADHADELGIDASRISIGGESAGANLAAAVALMTRDRGGPALVGQVLEVPALDMRMVLPSIDEHADAPMLTKQGMARCVEMYLADPADAQDPYASPLLAEDLSGLPPAYIYTAEFDPLRDDGEHYARRLEQAGIAVQRAVGWGQFHGSQRMSKVLPDVVHAHEEEVGSFLRRAHRRDP